MNSFRNYTFNYNINKLKDYCLYFCFKFHFKSLIFDVMTDFLTPLNFSILCCLQKLFESKQINKLTFALDAHCIAIYISGIVSKNFPGGLDDHFTFRITISLQFI